MRGPIVFWSLILLVILGVFALFRALASHPAGARVAAASPVASPQPGATAPGSAPAWGGKPLQARVKRTGVAVPPPAVGTEPANKGLGLTPEEAAERIRQAHPALVLFFSTESAQEMFPHFVKLTQSPAADKVQVLAFATDQDASAVDTFLRVHQAGFEAPLVQPAKPGEWKAALSEVGIKVGKQLETPLLVVVGSGGEVLGQWQGASDMGPVEAALTKATTAPAGSVQK